MTILSSKEAGFDKRAMKVMQLNVLDTHDRLVEMRKSIAKVLSQGAEECRKKNVDAVFLQSRSPYIYIFAHVRTEEDGATKRMFWQPRLTKPNPEPNSYLFRLKSHTDVVEVVWLLPAMECWSQYKKGNVTESDKVEWSISMYQHNRDVLKRRHPPDLTDEQVKPILE